MKAPKIVMVEWIDAVTNPNWRPLADVKSDKSPLSHNVEVGYIVKKDDKAIVIGHGWNVETGDVSSTTAIPSAWVKRVRPV